MSISDETEFLMNLVNDTRSDYKFGDCNQQDTLHDELKYYYDDEGINLDIKIGMSVEELYDKYKIHVIFPGTDELQVDIDGYKSLKVYNRNIEVLKSIDMITSSTIVPSKTKGNFHATTILKSHLRLDPIAKSGLQSFLGSDPVRERTSMKRYLKGEKDAWRFFEY